MDTITKVTNWVMYEDEDGYIEMREMEDDDEQ